MPGESPALSWTPCFGVFHAVCMFYPAAVQKDQRNPPGQALMHVYLFTGHDVPYSHAKRHEVISRAVP